MEHFKLREKPIVISMVEVFICIADHPGLCVGEVSQKIDLSTSTVSKQITALVRAKLIIRTQGRPSRLFINPEACPKTVEYLRSYELLARSAWKFRGADRIHPLPRYRPKLSTLAETA
ncbi:winged helix-turn-helix transcriptional regulator [Leptolyngbya sp. AN03gr2]|uniref:winged helix-turn-helix transcriptional regulator n=1 Tax=unclassified Leptolyngbya TaxID=2650499 RepID=UPI003D3193AD